MKIVVDERPLNIQDCLFSQFDKNANAVCILDNYNLCRNICNEEPLKCKALITFEEMNK